MKILVIGATAHLGYEICKKLLSKGDEVYAFHRANSDTTLLKHLPNINLVVGDLVDTESLHNASQGMYIVIATASTATPTQKGDNFKSVDTNGYFNLINACKENNVKQFVYTSIMPMGNANKTFPLGKAKLQVEQALKESGLTYTIIQPAAFMDVHFAFFGTDLPLRNTEISLLQRDSVFMQKFYQGIKNDISEKGIFNQIGNGKNLFSYITVDNVADFHVSSITHSEAKNNTIQIGGPEELSALDIKALFEKLLHKKLKVKSTPPLIMKIMSYILSPFNINAANIMAMNYVMAHYPNTIPDAKITAEKYGVKLTTALEYLTSKMD